MTLAEILAAGPPDVPVFRAARDARVLTCADLDVATRTWSPPLDDAADPPVVALVVADPLRFARAFLGLLAAGATVAPLDPRLDAAQLRAEVAEVGATRLVADRSLDVDVTPLAPAPVVGPAPRRAGKGRVLLRSSGTTGPRKKIVLTEHQLLHTARAIARHHGFGPGERGLNPLPLFHVNAEVVGLLATAVSGAELVLDDGFHRDLWEVAAQHRATWVNAVPAILAILPSCGRAPESVRFVRSASAPLPVPVLDRFEAACGVPVVETYGMTEAASQICANPVAGPRKPGSVGPPVDIDLRIVAADGKPCGVGELGQVQIRGDGVVTGTAWLSTGDVGYQDADGYVFLSGRLDDVINRGGEKVFPRDVEAVLLADDRVEDAVVVGAPDEVLGSVPVAFVLAAPGSGVESLTADLHERCARTLARFRRPARIEVVETLPQGPTGKVSRVALRAVAAGGPVLVTAGDVPRPV
ncbi:MAG TPA: AMP-binding protein [Mycobacteriales bacterium]